MMNSKIMFHLQEVIDELKGDNLPDTASKKGRVIYALDRAIAGISRILGRSAENALKKVPSERVFFLSNIQKQLSAQARLTRSELKKMLEWPVVLARYVRFFRH